MLSRMILLLGSLFLLPCSIAEAAIFYQIDKQSGNQWEYSYSVENQLAMPIEEFTLYFDLGLYENLVITGSSSQNWDGFAAQADINLPDDGFVDWLALAAPISPGLTLDGFSVAFDYLGNGTPGVQFFEIVDPLNFNVISNGNTQLKPLVFVPEPSTLLLLISGLCGCLLQRVAKIECTLNCLINH